MNCIIATVIVLSAAGPPVSAEQRELRLIADEVAGLGVRIDTLSKEYETPENVGRPSASQRLMDAEILYLLGDYQRASVVLLDMVEGKKGSATEQARVMFYLAESLYKIGNNISARQYFEILAAGTHEHVAASIRRLIQISDRLERWDGVGERVLALASRGPLSADIAYIYAKSLLLQNASEQALKIAKQVPKEHRLYAKARYLMGVSELRLGKLAAARDIFAELAQTTDEFDDALSIRDLSSMNTGRIFFEDNRFTEAMDAYQNVKHTSPLFEQSLYEVTWTFVRAAAMAKDEADRQREFRRALNALEILLLSEADSTLAPEARLLLGSIRLRLQDFTEAGQSFESVIERYRPMRDELQRLSAEIPDPVAYYDEVAERTKEGKSLLPPLAVKWASGQKRLQKAMHVVEDLDRSDVWIRDAERVVDKLMMVLDSDKRASFFPALQDAQTRYMALRNSLVAANQRVLAVKREALAAALTPEQAAELEQVLAERSKLEPQYRDLPQEQADYDSRLARLRNAVLELQKVAYQLRYPIVSMRQEVKAMRSWLGENKGALGPKDRTEFVERLEQQEAEIREFEVWQDKLEQEVAREVDLVGGMDGTHSHDDAVRLRYQATLEREHEILAIAAGRSGSAVSATVKKAKAAHDEIAMHNSKLDAFKKKFDTIVANKAREVTLEVLKEQNYLIDYRLAVEHQRQGAKEVVGGIAASSLNEVQRKFHDIVLRGDVGIVDVVWQRKEQQTHEISRRVNEQSRELQLLDAEFSEVLEDQ